MKTVRTSDFWLCDYTHRLYDLIIGLCDVKNDFCNIANPIYGTTNPLNGIVSHDCCIVNALYRRFNPLP